MTATCPACGAAESRPAHAVRGFHFRRCAGCRSLWVEDPPPPERTADLYGGRGYYRSPGLSPSAAGAFHGYKDYLSDRRHIEAKFAEVIDRIETRVAPGRLLDVGSGPGFLLAAARDRGWRVRGLDLNPWACAYAREELGLDVAHEPLEDAAFENASFDAVTMMDLIEHVADPGVLVSEAARITRPGGALAMLTPDAGSPVSRALGRRWPELERAPEHLALLSVKGAASLVERHGFEVVGWHSVGKRSALETLLADVEPAAPAVARLLGRVARRTGLGHRELYVDPRTKFVLYAVRRPDRAPRESPGRTRTAARPPRLPRRTPERSTEQAVLEELRTLARSERLCDWMFEQFSDRVRGEVVEVGAGIGTFSERALAAGVEQMLLVEPEPACAAELERRFDGDDRVAVAREQLPESASLAARAGRCDFVLCQNVLEHIADDRAAAASMAAALRPGGRLTLLVPAIPRLFGALDAAYGHWRRYTPRLLREVVAGAGLALDELYYFNALGIPGWWLKNRVGGAGIGPGALRAYEALVGPWRALERRVRPPVGLSLIAHARKP